MIHTLQLNAHAHAVLHGERLPIATLEITYILI